MASSWYVSFWNLLSSLNITFVRLIDSSSSFQVCIVFNNMNMPKLIYPFSCWWIFLLFLFFSFFPSFSPPSFLFPSFSSSLPFFLPFLLLLQCTSEHSHKCCLGNMWNSVSELSFLKFFWFTLLKVTEDPKDLPLCELCLLVFNIIEMKAYLL